MTDLLDKRALPQSEIARRRKAMDSDVWLFIKWICKHGADDIARFHRPLAYLLSGDAIRLSAALNTYDSEVVTQIKADLARRGIDWNTPRGVEQLSRLLRRVNDRASRSLGKTSIGLDVMLWLGSRDPNVRIGIASKSDPAAWAMCTTIGNIMKSPEYAMYYSDRLFRRVGGGFDYESFITQKWVRMNGRTVAEQETIEARGVTSQWYSKHYHVIYCDDLSSTEAKQGEATVEDAIRFIASLHGISISDRWGGTRFVFNGTIQGPRDDHAKLSSNPEYLTLIIPIWKRKDGAPWTLQNMLDDGMPTLPELYSIEAIKEKRTDTLANDTLGSISWLQNFLLCAHSAGTMQFTAELLKRQKFHWETIQFTNGTSRRYIRRYLWKPDWSPKTDEQFNTKGEPCKCYRGCGLPNHAYVQFDPLETPRMLGVDQAISGRGDYWGVGAVAFDHQSHLYQLKGEYDRGYWKMPVGIAKTFTRWGGSANAPRKVGMESNTWQAVSADWMKQSDELRFLAHRIEKLPPTTLAKVMRILRDIHANLEMGRLWIDPDDSIFEQCALEYNSASPDTQWDDPLDCVAMAVQLHRTPASEETAEQRRRAERDAEIAYMRDVDQATGVDLSTDYMEAMWN